MSAYFVTAIGTDIGKTFASCALLHGARAQGIPGRGIKPVACGATRVDEGDVAQLVAASGTMHDVSPFWYRAALSPHMAAAEEEKAIDLVTLNAWTTQQIAAQEFTLIEGVGGLMVPLNHQQTVRDWIVSLGLPAIVVASNYLGALNHTLATIELLRMAHVPIAALIISEAAQGVSLTATETTLRAFASDIQLIVSQPRVSSWEKATVIHALAKELV